MALPSTDQTIFRPDGKRRMGLARGSGPLEHTFAGSTGWLLVEGGRGELRAGAEGAAVDGRADVFEGPGWSALVAPGDQLRVTGQLRWVLAWRPAPLETVDATRLIDPDAVAVEVRGDGATQRTVRTYVGSGSLICGETLNPPGGWSSWPPHRHEHDELYLYRFDAPGGFGVQLQDDEPAIVRDGASAYIESGYHPVVAAPGSAMYYLWALAGSSPDLTPQFDPRYAENGGP